MRRSQARPAEELHCNCLGTCKRARRHAQRARPAACLAWCCSGAAHARGIGVRHWQAQDCLASKGVCDRDASVLSLPFLDF